MTRRTSLTHLLCCFSYGFDSYTCMIYEGIQRVTGQGINHGGYQCPMGGSMPRGNSTNNQWLDINGLTSCEVSLKPR